VAQVSLKFMAADRRLEKVRASAAAPTSGVLRVARGAFVGVTAMGLSVGGHLVAGGSLPAPTGAATLLALAVSGGVACSGRRWTLSALVSVLLGVQVVCHVALAGHAGSHLADAHQQAAHGMSAAMVLAHVLAAIATAVLLSRGESWCWRLVALLSRPVHLVRLLTARTLPAFGARSLSPAVGSLAVLRSLLLGHAQPRRGPPALLAA
jgi:hypothetical protein